MKLSRDKIQRMIDVGSGGSSGGVSSSELAGLLAGYATESWVDEHYISIDFFSRLFQAHGTENGSEIDVMPNDMETVITSVESMFGFWTNLYISALGSNGAAPAGISLGMLTDVTISGTPSAGQVLTFDAVSGMWVNGNAQAGATTLANLTDVTLTTPQANQVMIYDYSSQKWVNSYLKTVNGYSLIGSGNIDASGGGTGNYLPLAGGVMTGAIRDSYGRNLAAFGDSYVIYGSGNYGNTNIYGNQILFCNPSGSAVPGIVNGNGIEINGRGSFTSYATARYISFHSGVPANITGYVGRLSGGSDDTIFLASASAAAITISTNSKSIDLLPEGKLQLNTGVSITDSYNRYLVSYDQSFIGYGGGNTGSTNIYGDTLLLCSGDGGTVRARLTSTGLGIGVIPSYPLHVAGTIYATGAITALSDARKKDITGEAGVTVEQIAHAPAVQFLWKDKERRKDGQQVGTLAQYWQTVLPEVVMDKGGELSMQYGVAALVSAIVTARKVVDHERRITELEKENERLKEEISQLRLN